MISLSVIHVFILLNKVKSNKKNQHSKLNLIFDKEDRTSQQTCRCEFVILLVFRNRESRRDVVLINCRDI